MTQFGLRYLYKHLGDALGKMPFEITRHNRVIAVVSPSESVKNLKLNKKGEWVKKEKND